MPQIKQTNLMRIMEVLDSQNVDMNATYAVYWGLPFKSDTVTET